MNGGHEMKYEKAEADVVKFDFSEFMAASMANDTCNVYSDGKGHTCGTYVKGQSCTSFTSTSWGGTNCSSYNGRICSGYTDNRHPASNPCSTYGYSCGNF